MTQDTIITFTLPPVNVFNSSNDLWTRQELRLQMKDTLQQLLAENTQEIEDAHPCLDIIYNHKNAKFLFALAKSINVPHETKYLALEIFHSFLINHLDSLLMKVASSTSESWLKDQELKTYARKIREQVPLRALASLMIASKLTFHKNYIASSLTASVPWLKIQPKDICKSEGLVLKHLGFRCCKISSVLDYLGLAVSVAGLYHGDSTQFSSKVRKVAMKPLSAESVYETAIDLMDYVCLNREMVYEKLCYSLTCQPLKRSSQYQAMFARVLADRILLAGSVVVAAAVVLGGPTAAATVVGALCAVLPVTHKDLLIFATCLLECINISLPLMNLLKEKEVKKISRQFLGKKREA